jgi:hypothetical protein
MFKNVVRFFPGDPERGDVIARGLDSEDGVAEGVFKFVNDRIALSHR